MVPLSNSFRAQGDQSEEQSAQDSSSSGGCIMRLHKDGSKPNDNYAKSGVKECWVKGLRNGWRMAWDSGSDRLFIGEVGGESLPP